jgi:Sulfatase
MDLRAGVRRLVFVAFILASFAAGSIANGQTTGGKPNIDFIMGDDVGWSKIGVYNQGIMAGRMPNLYKLAAQGMRFTDYYAGSGQRRWRRGRG